MHETKIRIICHSAAEQWSCRTVELPNVGKSTLFKCISFGRAQTANFPFCTIDQNIGATNVPDERLNELAKIKYDDYLKYGSEAACRAAGRLFTEGKDYVVEDGDIMHFLFNV